MAARVVRRERLLPLARIESLQNARARSALALSLLYHLPRLQRRAVPARVTALSLSDRRFPSIGARQREGFRTPVGSYFIRFLSASDSRFPCARGVHGAIT